MKKIVVFVIALVLFFLTPAFAAEGTPAYTIKFGIDKSCRYQIDLEWFIYHFRSVYEMNDSFSISLERTLLSLKNAEIGLGITYQYPRYNVGGGQFQFIPAYGLIRFYRALDITVPYLVGHLGYNHFSQDDYSASTAFKSKPSGGLYYGAGAGIRIRNKYRLEVLASINEGTIEEQAAYGLPYKFDIKHFKITYSFGIDF